MSSEKSHISRSCALWDLWGGSKDPPLVTMVFFLTSLWQMVLGHPTGEAAIAGHSLVLLSLAVGLGNSTYVWTCADYSVEKGQTGANCLCSHMAAEIRQDIETQRQNNCPFRTCFAVPAIKLTKPLANHLSWSGWVLSGKLLEVKCWTVLLYALLNFTKPPQRCTKRFSALLLRHGYASLWTAIYCHMQQSSA